MSDRDTGTLPATSPSRSPRLLDAIERSSEIMFGLIMALTFTCSVSVVSSTRNDIRVLLIAALSCNVAWGIVDAAMHILTQLVARKRQRNFAVEIADTSAHEARKMILERLPGGLEGHLSTEELDPLVKAVRSLPLPSPTYLPNREDLLGAVAIFLLVFLSTVPIALPFLLIGNVAVALRTSNAIAVALLFLVGIAAWPIHGTVVALDCRSRRRAIWSNPRCNYDRSRRLIAMRWTIDASSR